MKKFEEYYIGLDMGTGSVGWAVTDPTYNIIKRHGITLFADSQKMLKQRIHRKYPMLSDKQVAQLANKKYAGWGRLSRTFLENIESVNKETGEVMNSVCLFNTAFLTAAHRVAVVDI